MSDKNIFPQNPFNLTEEQARSVCHTSLALCNGIPLPQSRAVLETLNILEVGFPNIREYLDSGSVLPGGGNNGITLHDVFRKHLVGFFEGCSDVASKRLGFEYAKAIETQNLKEIEMFCIEAGYTLTRSVFLVER